MNQEKFQFIENDEPSLNIGAKLSILGAAVSTIGDAIQTIAAVIALEETLISDAQQQQNQKDQDKKLQMMQQQIDELNNKLSFLNSSKN